MTIDRLTCDMERLEVELAEAIAGMKNLYGEDYQKAEMELLRIKKLIHQVRVFIEVEQYRAVS